MYILKKFKNTPVCVVEDHHQVLSFIYKCIGSKHVPLYDNVLVHFDSHPDLLIPSRLQSQVVFDKLELFSQLSIENWILPAAYAGHFGTIVWIKPPWSKQIQDGTYTFYIGKHEVTNQVRVTCTEDYFLNDALFSNECELKDKKMISLIVVTIGGSIFHDGKRIDDLKHADAVVRGVLKDREIFILDIDLDFFSTRNPFLELYKNGNLYEKLKRIYSSEMPKEKVDLEQVTHFVQLRQKKLDELEDLFRYLDENGSLANYSKPSEYLKEISKIEQEMKEFYVEIDWLLIHDMGCTIDAHGLPHHATERCDIEKFVHLFSDFLNGFPDISAVITMSRSSADDYCPLEDVDYIQNSVLSCLRKKYDSLNVQLKYEEDSE